MKTVRIFVQILAVVAAVRAQCEDQDDDATNVVLDGDQFYLIDDAFNAAFDSSDALTSSFEVALEQKDPLVDDDGAADLAMGEAIALNEVWHTAYLGALEIWRGNDFSNEVMSASGCYYAILVNDTIVAIGAIHWC